MKTLAFTLDPEDNTQLINLCGAQDANLKLLASKLGVKIRNRGHQFQLSGPEAALVVAKRLIETLYATATSPLTPQDIELATTSEQIDSTIQIVTPKLTIAPRSPNQARYLTNIQSHDLNFAVGPAGTGKTYLATAYAVQLLEQEKISRIVIARPVVEAGENLGFLPGDIAQKVDPYLRPIYDALYETLGFSKVNKLITSGIIEIAPLAFMRGRTLNEAIIILDEAQNTTTAQMKMFLTRLGFNSKAIVTGDITQSDLPKHQASGLQHAISILKDIPQISYTIFQARDVVRHSLVQKIVTAYDNNTPNRNHN